MLDKIMSNKEDSVSRTTHMLNTEGPVTEKVSENWVRVSCQMGYSNSIK